MDKKQIGKYQILEKIASGTQGTVSRAFDTDAGRLVAIKVLRHSMLEDESFIERFRREADLAGSVDHPNVIRIFDMGQDGDQHYIIMEFLPETLFRLMEQGEFSVSRAVSMSAGIADGLGAIHELGIVHRDMKPQNVLITPEGVPKITDFGIARDETQATITQDGVMMGTPHYMSPEQAEGGRADARSDVYALGCMTYQMLTGEMPFSGGTPLAVLRKHVEQQARPIATRQAGVPPSLSKVVERAMEKDPNLRYSNGFEMGRALRAAVTSSAPKPRPTSSPSTVPSPARPSRSSSALPPSSPPSLPPRPPDPPPRKPDPPAASKSPRDKVLEEENRAANERMAARRQKPSALGRLVSTLFVIGAISGVAIAIFLYFSGGIGGTPEPVEVVHWSTGHLTRDGLLPEMAAKFNSADFKLPNGSEIKVRVFDAPSELQAKSLVQRVKFGTQLDLNEITNGYVVENIPDPTILTPSSAHWLVTANFELNREVVDIDAAESIVRPVIGIVTYEEMARCLGWPDREIGFADIIALRNNPEGWASYSCAKKEWGQRPLLAFTDPTTSSTGRSLLLGLYAIAAGKAPEDLSIADVNNPSVIAYVKDFQNLIDHYQIGTTVMNTKIYQGTSFGHFFIMPEDNLIHLYEGTERAFDEGIEVTAPPIGKPMVMIYPKEGAMPRNNCACIVNADWVSADEAEAAKVWIDFIRQDEQQRAFMAAGFRPGTDISLNDPASKIRPEFGLNPNPPRVILNPSLMKPEVAAAIDANWTDVKRPGIVTFVVDTSASMAGDKIQQARDGLIKALDAMPSNNQAGFLSFGDTVRPGVSVAPLTVQHRQEIVSAIDNLRTNGQTALYDAIKIGVEMTDAVVGDPNSIRAVVVLTDGQANKGETRLDDIIRMSSRNGVPIPNFSGFENVVLGRDQTGRRVDKRDIFGSDLAIETEHQIQIFFIGVGEDADIQVGRMLAGATAAEFQGTAEEDLANLLEKFGKYF